LQDDLEELQLSFMSVPSQEDWLQISPKFEQCGNFPNCIGRVANTSDSETSSESLYYTYKRFFSVVLLAVCDANYHFTFVDIAVYGKNLGTRIFQNSVLRNKISGNECNIPDHRSVTGESDILPHVFVGDEAFVLSTRIMRPYSDKKLSIEKSI
jgi:hypothetical protein